MYQFTVVTAQYATAAAITTTTTMMPTNSVISVINTVKQNRGESNAHDV